LQTNICFCYIYLGQDIFFKTLKQVAFVL